MVIEHKSQFVFLKSVTFVTGLFPNREDIDFPPPPPGNNESCNANNPGSYQYKFDRMYHNYFRFIQSDDCFGDCLEFFRK